MPRPPPRTRITSSIPSIRSTKPWRSSCRNNCCKSLLRAHGVADVDVADMLLLPHHRIHDPGAAGWMVKEEDLFPGTRLQLAVCGKLEHGGGKGVRLAYGIQSENVGLMFGGSGDAVADGCRQKEEN